MEQDYTQLAEALRMRDEGKSESEILAHFSGAAKSEIGESLDVVHWIEAESAAMAMPPRASLQALLAKIEVAAPAKPAPVAKPSVMAKPTAAVSAAAVSTIASATRTAAPAASSLASVLPLSKKAILAKMNSTKSKPSTDSAMKPSIARKPVSFSMPSESMPSSQPVSLADRKDWTQFMSNISWRSFLPVAAVAAVLLLVGVYKGLPGANPTLPNQVAVAPADNTATTASETASNVTVAMVSPTDSSGASSASATAPAPTAKPAAMKTAALAAPASSSGSAAAPSSRMTPDQAYSQLASGSDNEANAVSGSDSDVSDSNSKSFAGLASTYDENTI